MSASRSNPLSWRPDGRFTVSFLEAPAREINRELCTRLRAWGYLYESIELGNAAEDWRSFLYQCTWSPTEGAGVLIPASSTWCAFIDNDKIGGIPQAKLATLSERMRIRSVALVMHDE